ncbi:LacI family DNA-binding transcriptional regulator [Kineosporia sp. R_H_3]|uniref:LacI family DNA-binding transcriptional regulator n=1 Tax=Kineosporia sp. R_H_3 TaxID=1961848 RepID=UPI000B4BF61A|nr:LacI family DNA-binding transcriptional regulator [Kineosporia sp. R_H_3]
MPSETAGSAATRRPTIQDVAAAAGVSKGLVSKVFNGGAGPSAATTSRVIAVADRLGYRPNRSATLLAKRRTRLLGVTMLPSNLFHGELADLIQPIAEKHGYDIVLGSMTGYSHERRAIETLIDFRCEALVLVGPTMPAAQLAAIIGNVPAVVVGRKVDLPGADVVRCDDERGVHDVIDHLVALGHRRIAHLDGGSGAIAALRRRAYRAAMTRHRLEPVVLPGGMTEEDGARAVTDLLGHSAGVDVTAVATYNDRCAVGVLDALARRGIDVPGEISVAGFDDSLQARHALIELTTVDQSSAEQARLAIQAVMERLDGTRAERREIVLPPALIVRRTTARVGRRRGE